jgi:hypothetical protein
MTKADSSSKDTLLCSDAMLLEKLRAEMVRLQTAQAAGIRADQALEALQKQLQDPDMVSEGDLDEDGELRVMSMKT